MKHYELKETVVAGKIASIESTTIELEDGDNLGVTHEFIQQFTPRVGDYVIIKSGVAYLMKGSEFEERYCECPPEFQDIVDTGKEILEDMDDIVENAIKDEGEQS